MQDDKIIEEVDDTDHKEILTIFRRNIPNVLNIKKDKKRIKYCQRCGKWLTHFLSQNEHKVKEGEILRFNTDKKMYKWKNKLGVIFTVCNSCNFDLNQKGHKRCDLHKITISEFKSTYKLNKSKQGKVYDYIKRYNSEV